MWKDLLKVYIIAIKIKMVQETKIIHDLLKNLDSLDKIRELISILGFSFADKPLSTRDFKDTLRDAITPDSLRIIGDAAGFPVIFFKKKKFEEDDIDKQLIRLERELIKKLPPEHQDACIVVATSPDFKRVHFINAKRIGNRLILRRYLIGKDQNMRTAAERLSFLKLTDVSQWDKVLEKVEEAFDREEVTEKFFKDFEKIFRVIKNEFIQDQNIEEHLAHQFLHAFLNRLMFIYYVQRKGWLADGDIEFIKTLWNLYQEGDYPDDTFYEVWLSTLFFSAFNNKHGYEHIGLPKEIVSHFKLAPFLNGGLFRYREGIDDQGFKVTDEMFRKIFERILNRYNFTVTEDTPFDQNIAVDPEMLGIVYESLVNTTDLSDEQSEAGIFYTPRVEVDFMCRRSLVEYLSNHTSAEREDLYQFIFPEEGEQLVPEFRKKVREEIKDALLEMTVVDPACGSGAFLVGMMQVVLELRQELARQADETFDEFTEKKRIIERSLYGVDVKEWAINVAQLRLWLALIEVADEKKLDLKAMKLANDALLPSLSFKLRAGDSLVQEIAGITLPVRSVRGKLSPKIQRKVRELRKAKTDFYFNRGDITEHSLIRREISLYESILDEQIENINENRKEVSKKAKAVFQQDLMAVMQSKEERDKQFEKHTEDEDKKRKAKLEEIAEYKKHLLEIKKSLPKKKQLFWSIEFAEIFSERSGFDIVIGNPPYIKKEKIADPIQLEQGIIPPVKEKREYKNKLERMIRDDWKDDYPRVDKKSDLYIYFYLKGLSLLNPRGVFCYITSNSWLDVGYGKGLQEFLLKHGKVYAIYDNEVKRSFKRANVNTIIAVLGLSTNTKDTHDHIARFVMFKQPFEAVTTSGVLIKSEDVLKRETISSSEDGKPQARVVAMAQASLYKAGVKNYKNNELGLSVTKHFDGTYSGNKWGGKYLRAPEIYWSICETCNDKLISLGKISKVIGYVHDNNTGSKFRNMNFVKTVKELQQVLLVQDDPVVRKYGVNAKGNSRQTAPILYPRTLGNRHLVAYNPDGVVGKEFYRISPLNDADSLMIAGVLNSTFGILQREILGLTNLGDGGLKFSGKDIELFLITKNLSSDDLKTEFLEFAKETVFDIPKELQKSTRLNLDKIIFDFLDLTKTERNEVYQAVKKLVGDRLNKARSVR